MDAVAQPTEQSKRKGQTTRNSAGTIGPRRLENVYDSRYCMKKTPLNPRGKKTRE